MPRFGRDKPGGGEMLGYIIIAALAFVILSVVVVFVLTWGVYHFLRDRGMERDKALAVSLVIFIVLMLSMSALPGC